MISKKERTRKSLRYSILDGFFHSIMMGIGEYFLIPFAIFLGATNIQLSLVKSLPQLVGSFLQLFSINVLKFLKSRKKIVCWIALMVSIIWIPMILSYYFGGNRVYWLILLVTIYWSIRLVQNPIWNSWMSDLVDLNIRGKYFGSRNRITSIGLLLGIIIGGLILNKVAGYLGFAIVFTIALIAKFLSYVFLTKKHEPEFKIKKRVKTNVVKFIAHIRENNFGNFVLYMSIMDFSVFLAAPFFAAYMLKDLQFSYLDYMLIMSSAIVIKILFMPIWGKYADRYGNKKTLMLSGALMPLVPILWMFSDNLFYLLLVEAYSGFFWAGFQLSTVNMLLNTTITGTRTRFISYYNFLSGVAMFIGGITGGLIVKYNYVFWSKYLFVFLASGIMRFSASVILLPKIKEIKGVRRIGYDKLLYRVMGINPSHGGTHKYIFFGQERR